MPTINIVIVAFGYAECLGFTLDSVFFASPTSKVHVLTYPEVFDKLPADENLTHSPIPRNDPTIDYLRSIYRHASPNPSEYELCNYWRWMLIYDYMLRTQIENVFSFDWDTILACDLLEDFESLDLRGMTLPVNACYIERAEEIVPWLADIFDTYENPDRFADAERHYKAKDPDWPSVSDMTLAWEWERLTGIASLTTVHRHTAFDRNISSSDNGWRMSGGIKSLLWAGPKVYGVFNGTPTRLMSLHCQGARKALMPSLVQKQQGKYVEAP